MTRPAGATMIEAFGADTPPGVYRFNPDGLLICVHEYAFGDYRLVDIRDYWRCGEPLDGGDRRIVGLEFDRLELARLSEHAAEPAFEHPPEFHEMARAVCASAAELPGDTVRFFANF